MKVLLVNGSPHKAGCTHEALQYVGNELAAEGIGVDEFWIGAKPIGGCMGCYKCAERGECVMSGDKVEEFLAIADEYDGYVFGSPVHYAGITGNMKAFMDRAFFSNQGRVTFAQKPAAVVTSARRAGTTAALEQLEKHIQYSQMFQVGSRYWNMVHGAAADEVAKDEEGVQIMQTLGRNMAYILKCIEAGRAAGVPLPAPIENRVATNFIR